MFKNPTINLSVLCNSGKQHVVFTHELQSALRLMVGFLNIYYEHEQICHFSHYNRIEVKLTVNNLSFSFTNDNAFISVDSNSCISVTIQN